MQGIDDVFPGVEAPAGSIFFINPVRRFILRILHDRWMDEQTGSTDLQGQELARPLAKRSGAGAR